MTIEKKAPFKLKLTVSAIVLLVLTLSFNLMLTLSSLENLYLDSLVSSYNVIGKDFQRNMEKALLFGKKIEKFIGMNPMMATTLRYMSRQDSSLSSDSAKGREAAGLFDRYIAVAMPDGRILYSTKAELVDKQLPEKARIDFTADAETGTDSNASRMIRHGDTYLVMLPIRDRDKKWIATAILTFDRRQITILLESALIRNARVGAVILLIGTLGLIIGLNFIFPNAPGKRASVPESPAPFPKKAVSILVFLLIGLGQVGFSWYSTNTFRDYYLSISKEKSAMLNVRIREFIETLLNKGIKIDRLVKMDVMLGEIMPALPEVNDISIMDKDGNPLYRADQTGVTDYLRNPEAREKIIKSQSAPDPEYSQIIQLRARDELKGMISTNISKPRILAKQREIIMDALTVLAIAFLFFVELLFILFQYIDRRTAQTGVSAGIHFSIIRPAAFLFFFGYNVSASFLPLHMENLYEPFFGLSKDMIMGLPISVAMFTAGISPFISGVWLDRRGWHEPFLAGLILSGIGLFYAFMAQDALHFIISRGITGLGYGLVFTASMGFVSSHTDTKTKAQGITWLIAGCYAGYICGSSTGAMLADRIGYNLVFLFGAVMVILVIGYTFLTMRSALRKPQFLGAQDAGTTFTFRQSLDYIFSRNILSLNVLVIIPFALVSCGLLYYFLPIYIASRGMPGSTVGRLLMINGVFFIYAAPYISRFIDNAKNKKNYIVLSGVMAALAFIIFYFAGGYIAAVAAVILLGLAGCFDASNAFTLKLEATRRFGEGKAMAMLSLVERIGQVLGPIVFGWLIIATDIDKGFTYMGIAYLIITVLFFLVAREMKPAEAKQETAP